MISPEQGRLILALRDVTARVGILKGGEENPVNYVLEMLPPADGAGCRHARGVRMKYYQDVISLGNA